MIKLWAKVKLYALAAGGALIALLAAYWRVREDGKNVIRAEQDRARLDAIKTRKETDDETAGMDATSLDTAYDRWMRDNKPR
jgi:hypothetical protein